MGNQRQGTNGNGRGIERNGTSRLASSSAEHVAGGERAYLHMTRLANNGPRHVTHHTTALCSPTRACLLTGRNHQPDFTHDVETRTRAKIHATLPREQ